MEKDITRVY